MSSVAFKMPDPDQPGHNRLKLWLPTSEEPSSTSGQLSAESRLSEFLEQWYIPIILLGAEEEAAPATIKLYREAMARWIQITNDPPLRLIDDFLLVKFQKGLREVTYSRGKVGQQRLLTRSTQKKILSHIRHVLYRVGPTWDPRRKTAGLIERALHITISSPPVIRKEPFSVEQAKRMIAAALEMKAPEAVTPWQYWRAFVALHFYTGLRSGTILRLRQEHVKTKHNRLWLVIPGEIVSKTGKPIELPMHRRLAEALQPFCHLPTLLPQTHCYRYLFRLHGDLQRLAGISQENQISIHGWRRTHACEMAVLGATDGLNLARRALDHADAKTTEQHYCDIYQKLIVKLPDLWDDSAADPRQQRLF